jgi:uncharacterized protein YdbL (DUF1318 family)
MSKSLGTNELYKVHLKSANTFCLDRLNALIIVQQISLQSEDIDIGSMTKINNYQPRLKGTGRFTLNELSDSYDTCLAKAIDVCNLIDNFIEIESKNIENNYNDAAEMQLSSELAQAVVERVASILEAIKTLKANYEAAIEAISKYQTDYNTTLTTVIESLGTSVQQYIISIDDLNKQAQTCISDITAGGAEVTKGLAKLAIGMITMVSNSIKSPKEKEENDDDDDKADKASKRKLDLLKSAKEGDSSEPNVGFVIESIEIFASGVETSTAAAARLESINKDLSKQYQILAQQNESVAIAKTIQVQNQLFTDNLKLSSHVVELDTEWTKVKAAYQELSTAVLTIKDATEANALVANLKQSSESWKSLATSLDGFKKNIISNNIMIG